MKDVRDTVRARILRDNMSSTCYRPYRRPQEIISRFLPYTWLGKSKPFFRISIENPTGGGARKALTGCVDVRGGYLCKSLYVAFHRCSNDELENIVKIEVENGGEWELIWTCPAYRNGDVAAGEEVPAGPRPARKFIPGPDCSPEVLESAAWELPDPEPASPESAREPGQLCWDW